MKEDRSGDTAMGASVIRAAHQLLDERPLILDDPVSPVLIGEPGASDIRENPEKHKTPPARALRSHIVLRSRYAEDELRLAVESGIAQFINLGAGFDTFSFRQPEWTRGLRIVEIDHPATQRAKRETLLKVHIPLPANVAFQPLDLEEQELTSVISSTGLNPSLPTFAACLGVLAYLRPKTVQRVFTSVAGLPRGSRFVFAFASSQAESPPGAPSIASRTASVGEPWLTRFEINDLKAGLQAAGFREVTFLDPSEAAERYFRGRKDLPAPRRTRLCSATV